MTVIEVLKACRFIGAQVRQCYDSKWQIQDRRRKEVSYRDSHSENNQAVADPLWG